jgi:UDP-2-acetamido-2-deoxy-ribo-hexuluronate aminotransferase
MSGTFGHASFTSFYPSKPLGGIGDGGMVFTANAEVAAKCRSLREHGQSGRHVHRFLGMNSRLDTLQAAALLVKLRTFEDEVELRCQAARRYDDALADVVQVPLIVDDSRSSYAQYTIRSSDRASRDSLVDHLEALGVPTAVHYPMPVHTQESMQAVLSRRQPTPVTDDLCQTVVSLPLSAYITIEDQNHVIEAVHSWAAMGNAAAAGS